MPGLRHASSIAALAVLLVILGISAVGSAAAATLRRGIVETIDTLDPRGSTTPEARLIARDLFEGLVTLDAQRRPVPGAARSWELSEDGRTYLFRLRPDARWSNGEPVRAEAFVHAFRRAATNRDPKVRSLLRHVANASAVASGQAPPEALGVDAPDDGTLRLRLDIRQPSILAALADVALSPVHSGQSRDGGTDPPVTNGPYRVASWEPGKRLVLERNRWHRDALTGAADQVHYVALGGAAGRLDAFRRGELDILPVADGDLAWAQENAPDELHSSDLLTGAYLLVTASDNALGREAELRRALALALDRVALTKSVSPPGLRPTDALLPAPIAGYAPAAPADRSLSPADRRARAAALLAGASRGTPPLAEVTLCFENGRGPSRRQILATGLLWHLALGLAVKPVALAPQRAGAAEGCDLRAATLHADVADPLSFFRALAAEIGAQLVPETVEQLDAAGEEADPKARVERLREAERALLESHRVIPLWQEVANVLVKGRVGGWRASDPFLPTRFLTVIE